MPGRSRTTLVVLALTLAALAFALEGVLLAASGASAPAWAHWWCSPTALHAASTSARAGGLITTLLSAVRPLLPHWPHFLPLLLALATLVYLRRANARHHALASRAERPQQAPRCAAASTR